MNRWIAILAFLAAGSVFAAVAYGDVSIPLNDIRAILIGQSERPDLQLIVFEIRMPRVVLAFLVGMALAVAGAIAQAVMRNPLAEPSLLGINGGAALAAVVAIAFLDRSEAWLPWFSFVGASVAALLTFLFAWRQGTSSTRIILIGIGISALAGAGTTFLTAFGDIREVQRALIWMTGSVYDSDWDKIGTLAIWSSVPLILAWGAAKELDVIAFGDATAQGLGQQVRIVRGALVLLCTLLSGAAVAAAGLVGFVGLVCPHLARRLVGPRHFLLVPATGLLGGTLVTLSDLVGRIVIAPAQLPVGLMTAILGAPFFAYLLWGRRNATS